MPLELLWYPNMTFEPMRQYAEHTFAGYRLIMGSLSVLDKSVKEGKGGGSKTVGFQVCSSALALRLC